MFFHLLTVPTYQSLWMQPGQQEEYQVLWGNQEDTYHICCYHRFASKEARAWLRNWTLPNCLFLWHWIFWAKTCTISIKNMQYSACGTHSKSLKRASTMSLYWVLFSSSACVSATSCALIECRSLARQALILQIEGNLPIFCIWHGGPESHKLVTDSEHHAWNVFFEGPDSQIHLWLRLLPPIHLTTHLRGQTP